MKDGIIKTGSLTGFGGEGYFYIIDNVEQAERIINIINRMGAVLENSSNLKLHVASNRHYFRFFKLSNGNFRFCYATNIDTYLKAGLKKVYAKDLEISEVL